MHLCMVYTCIHKQASQRLRTIRVNSYRNQNPTTPFKITSNKKTHFYRTARLTVLKNSVHQLVSWYCEPCQPQRIISGLKTNFILSPGYSFHKSSYCKSLFLRQELPVTYFIQKPTQHNTTQLTSYFTEHINLSRKGKILSIIAKGNPRKTVTHVLGNIYIPRASQHGNLRQSSVTMSRVTFFVQQTHTGTRVSYSQHRKNWGQVFLGEMQVNGPKEYKIRQE